MKKITFNNIWKIQNQYVYEYQAKTRGLFNSKKIRIQFIADYPHYTLRDILWMVECTNNEDRFIDLAKNSTLEWSVTLDVQIGELIIKNSNKVNLSKSRIDYACSKQQDLKNAWSEETGINYPEDLGLVKR